MDAVRAACEEIGFFCVTGHGVPDEVIGALDERAREFFDLPDDVKRRVGRSGDELGGVTYSPLASEALAASRGERTPGDLKQMLDYGPGWPGDAWPGEPAGLRAAHERYFEALGDLAAHLRRIFALAAGLAPGCVRGLVRESPLVAAGDRLPRARRGSRARAAAGGRAFGLRLPHDSALAGLGRRTAGPDRAPAAGSTSPRSTAPTSSISAMR